jgi:hypothetical protein
MPSESCSTKAKVLQQRIFIFTSRLGKKLTPSDNALQFSHEQVRRCGSQGYNGLESIGNTLVSNPFLFWGE